MAVSMEALAMTGADYHEWGLEMEEWERQESEMAIPPHLLADDGDNAEEEEEEERDDKVYQDQDHDLGLWDVVVKASTGSYLNVLVESVIKCFGYIKTATTRTVNLKSSEIPERFNSMLRIVDQLKQLKF